MVRSEHHRLISVIQNIILLCMCIVTLFPFVVTISTALKDMTEIRSVNMTLFPQKPTLAPIQGILSDKNWIRYFANSFYVTLWSIVGALLINSLAGFAFARLEFRGKKVLFVLLLLGMMVPAQVTMLPAYVIMRYIPLAGGNNIWGQGGMGLLNSTTGLVIAYLCGSYGVFLYRQFLANFPSSLDDAARVDGLSYFGMYYRIYLPLSKPALATMVVIRATATWNDYIWPLLMTQKEKMYTVQLALSQFRSDSGDIWNMIMAATMFIMIPVIVLFLFLQKYFVEGIATSGLKG